MAGPRDIIHLVAVNDYNIWVAADKYGIQLATTLLLNPCLLNSCLFDSKDPWIPCILLSWKILLHSCLLCSRPLLLLVSLSFGGLVLVLVLLSSSVSSFCSFSFSFPFLFPFIPFPPLLFHPHRLSKTNRIAQDAQPLVVILELPLVEA